MNEPLWVEREDCLTIHDVLVDRFGGLAGVRDPALLEAALNRPRQRFAYGQPTLFELAGAYAAGLIQNHPFLDGNKRTGFIAAALFLEINGQHFRATEEEVVLCTLALAAGTITEHGYAAWLEQSSTRVPGV